METERVIKVLNKLIRESVATLHSRSDIESLERAINALENAHDINVGNKWIPFSEREADEEEKEAYGCECMLIGKLPDDEQEILVSYANGCVDTDIFMRDGYECYLDSGCDFVSEAVAWRPLPEPYKGDE